MRIWPLKKGAAPDVSRFGDGLLNEALVMSLEWGENWLVPINARLLEVHPELSTKDAQVLEDWCVAVRTFAFALVATEYSAVIEGQPSTSGEHVRQKFPQLSDDSLRRLHSQGMYYAWHG